MARRLADPYAGADALDVLRRKVREIQSWGKEVELDRARVVPPQSQAPPPLDPNGYLQARVKKKIARYYRPKAKLNARRAEQFRWVETAFAGPAALWGAYASFSASKAFGAWVAVLTMSGGSLSAHAAASRYDSAGTQLSPGGLSASTRQTRVSSAKWPVPEHRILSAKPCGVHSARRRRKGTWGIQTPF